MEADWCILTVAVTSQEKLGEIMKFVVLKIKNCKGETVQTIHLRDGLTVEVEVA